MIEIQLKYFTIIQINNNQRKREGNENMSEMVAKE